VTGKEFGDLVKSVTYKPGWSFRSDVAWSFGGKIHFVICHTEPDAANPSKTTTEIVQHQYLDWLVLETWTEEHAIEWLRHEILFAEEHEFKEFFRVGGVAPYPAHGGPDA
jgi:hypothetical protein